LYDQPGGVSGPGVDISSWCARLGIIGRRTENAITSAPTIVSFPNAPASRVQSTSGARISQIPLTQRPQRARSKRGERVSAASTTMTIPVITSLAAIAGSR
jgi:hypothetical protein